MKPVYIYDAIRSARTRAKENGGLHDLLPHDLLKSLYGSLVERTGLDPALDCESCHGPGSEYKKMSIMKNRDQAIAAGMVLPEAGFCKSCHTDDWDDGMLEAAHEHKPEPAS